jgi:hypothetical protein
MTALGPYAVRRFFVQGLIASALSAILAACNKQTEAAAPEPRPVRTITVEKHEAGTPVTLTGRIEAEDEVELGFRILTIICPACTTDPARGPTSVITPGASASSCVKLTKSFAGFNWASAEPTCA